MHNYTDVCVNTDLYMYIYVCVRVWECGSFAVAALFVALFPLPDQFN